jgi:hypothetical protein
MAMIVITAVVAAIEVASTIYRLLNQPKIRPPVGDLQISSALDGAPIPFGYGRVRVAGTLIWTPGLTFTKAGVPGSHGGSGFGGGATQFLFFANFAFAFCEGPATIFRIWADSKLVYDASPLVAEYPPSDFPAWSSLILYNIGDIVSYNNLVYVSEQQSLDIVPSLTSEATGGIVYWSQLGSYQNFTVHGTYNPGDVVIYDGVLYTNIQSTSDPARTPAGGSFNDHFWRTLDNWYHKPTIYPGTQTQPEDPTIQFNEGVANTPAERGICYVVWENFPLGNFGNRIPNLRAEVSFGDAPGPRVIQSAQYGQLGNLDPNTIRLNQPVLATDYLIAAAFWFDVFSSDTPTIDDDFGNTWTLLIAGAEKAIWYCANPVASDTLNVNMHYNGSLFAFGAEAMVIAVRDFTGVRINSASGVVPAVLTNGIKSVTIDGHGEGAAAWIGAWFTFTDDAGGELDVIPLMDDGGIILPPLETTPPGTTYDDLFGTLHESGASTILVNGASTTELSSVVTDICKRAGMDLSMIDVTRLTPTTIKPSDVVLGYAITRPTAAAEILKTLFSVYFFDACESDGTMKFVPRGLPPVMTIPEEDLGLLEDGAKVKPEQIGQAQDLPRRFTITYNDLAMSYQQGKQEKLRSSRIIKTRQQATLEVPITMESSFAMQVAEKTLYLAWLERRQYITNLWRALYLLLDPTDVLTFTYNGVTLKIRIVETLGGQGFAVKITGVSEDANNYISSARGSNGSGFRPQPLILNSPTILFLFDVPLLRDVDANPGGTGYYDAMSSTIDTWPGGSLFRSADDANYSAAIDSDFVPAPYGYTTTPLAAPRSPWTWDKKNSLTIKMSIGQLQGASDLNVLNGANALIIGDPATQRWEVIQFASATLVGPSTYQISRLIRARRGTDPQIATHIAAGEQVLLLPDGMLHETDPLSLINQLRYYKAVTIGQDITGTDSLQFTNTGNDLRPYTVTMVKSRRESSGDLTIAWIRRTRVGGAWLELTGAVPVSEDAEAYEIDVMNGASVVRTISGLTAPTAVYSVGDQTSDFGSPQASVALRIYQLSGQIGRGFAKAVTIDGNDLVLPPIAAPLATGAPVPVVDEPVTFSGTTGTLAYTPSTVAGFTTVVLFRNGIRQASTDFSVAAKVITLTLAAGGGDVFTADYYR